MRAIVSLRRFALGRSRGLISRDISQSYPRSKITFNLTPVFQKVIDQTGLVHDSDLSTLIAKAMTGGVYGMGLVTILGTLGIDTQPLIAGIGVTGFTIGFAIKEIANNFISGLLLVWDKPFSRGQYLRVISPSQSIPVEGIVESIDARYVVLKTRDGNLFMIPSVSVYTNTLLVGPTPDKVKVKMDAVK